jgi:hypothetical protein
MILRVATPALTFVHAAGLREGVKRPWRESALTTKERSVVPTDFTTRRLPARSLLLVAALAAFACFAALSGSARAAASGNVTGFTLTPSNLQAGGDPNVVADFTFGGTTYNAAADSVTGLSVTLPPGLLASTAGFPAANLCTMAELDATPESCPAVSTIGTATGTATIAGSIPGFVGATLYLMAPPSGTSDIDGIGVALSGGATVATETPIATATGAVSLTANSAGQPELVMAVSGLPTTFGGDSLQINTLDVTINGTTTDSSGAATSTPLTRMPTSCAGGTATVSTTTQTPTDVGSDTSNTVTPTPCSTLPYAPKLTASAAKDASDSGVAITTNVTQAADESASSALSLTIPSNVSPNLIGAATDLCSAPTATFSNCTSVGVAQAVSPLVATALSGAVYLTGSIASPVMTIAFPPPYALELNGAITTSSNKVAFTNIPDVPLTSLTVALKGGTTGLFQTSCTTATATANATGAFTGQNGATATATAPLTISGCSATTTTTPPPTTTTKKAGAPSISSASLSGLANRKPKLSFKLTAGKNGAPKLSSVTVKLPSGVSFVKKGLKKGVTVSGAKIKSVSLSGGKLTITLKSSVTSFSVKVSTKALSETKGLATKVKKKKTKSLKLSISAKDAKGTKTTITTSVKV